MLISQIPLRSFKNGFKNKFSVRRHMRVRSNMKKQDIGSSRMAANMDDRLVAGLAGSGFENASQKMKRFAARLRPFGYSFGESKNYSV